MFFDASTAREPLDPLFGARLRKISLSAGVLHLRGETTAIERPTVGIVGSRDASSSGLAFASLLAEEAARAGLCVVSGGARGVDAAAHRGALRSGGSTVLVMATPLDAPSPAITRLLAEDIVAARGLLISEYADGERVHRGHFLDRNRIVAALSDVLVVVDARERSGSLATARHALKLDRAVWVTPGAPWDEHTEGSNTLLRHGKVRAVTSLATFRDLMAERFDVRSALAAPDPRLLGLQSPRSIDEWRLTQNLDIARACRVMFDLVASGAVVRLADGRYVRRR